MHFNHSVAIKIKKDDLLEVLGLNQIVKILLGRMRASLHKMVNHTVLGCEKN